MRFFAFGCDMVWSNESCKVFGEGVDRRGSALFSYELNRDKVYSIIKSDNYSSMKVAESIGMKKEDEFITQYYNGDMLHFLYSVHR